MGGVSEDMDKDIELKDEKIDFLAGKEEISAEKLRADMGKLNPTELFAAQSVGAPATVAFKRVPKTIHKNRVLKTIHKTRKNVKKTNFELITRKRKLETKFLSLFRFWLTFQNSYLFADLLLQISR